MLTYANLINGLKLDEKRRLRPKLEGKINKWNAENGDICVGIKVDSELIHSKPEMEMVSFGHQEGISFEVSYEYLDLEYLRKLLKPYLMS